MPVHCECCGAENPKTIEAYTICCDEPICDGTEKHKYGFPDNFVAACCWGKAEEKFMALGKQVKSGMYRLE
jgi:hypothetical protein